MLNGLGDSSKQEADASAKEADVNKYHADESKQLADRAAEQALNVVNQVKAITGEETTEEIGLSHSEDFDPEQEEAKLQQVRKILGLAEQARGEAEIARTVAESARNQAEEARTKAESYREKSETYRDEISEANEHAVESLALYQNALKRAQAAQERAETINQNKTQAMSNMSHELRTPLNSIIGYSEMMTSGLGGELNEKQMAYASNIALSGHHVLNMVNDILDTSKMEAGKLTLTPKNIDVKSLVNELKGMLATLADQKNIHLSFEIHPDLNRVEADPARLRQIFLNLISNAIKFNTAGGKVEVKLYKSEDQNWMICQVKDTGIGIPTDKLPKLFSEFYQVDTSPSRQQEGTGLGLALTKKLIELHGGSISVESEEEVGSTFIFRMPVSIPSPIQ